MSPGRGRSRSSAASTRSDTDLGVAAPARGRRSSPRLIRRVRAEGWPVARRDPDGGEHTEPARYADIAVLLPTRATLPYLEQALDDAGIPARIESQSLVYATAEVQDLLAILTAIDDPADEIAVVAALRAPGVRVLATTSSLEFRAAGGRWDYRADVPPAAPADSSRRDGDARRCARCTSAAGGTP